MISKCILVACCECSTLEDGRYCCDIDEKIVDCNTECEHDFEDDSDFIGED